jgi:hypothetical protein
MSLDEIDQLIDAQLKQGEEQRIGGVCVGCGATYFGTTDERDQWRAQHVCQ